MPASGSGASAVTAASPDSTACALNQIFWSNLQAFVVVFPHDGRKGIQQSWKQLFRCEFQ